MKTKIGIIFGIIALGALNVAYAQIDESRKQSVPYHGTTIAIIDLTCQGNPIAISNLYNRDMK